MFRRRDFLMSGSAFACAGKAHASEPASAFDDYIRGYVDSANFAGVVRIERDGRLIFERAYGLSDMRTGRANTTASAFHIASVSMQYTAAAVLRLADQGRIDLDATAASVVGPLPGFEAVTLRQLLMHRSGLPDINDRPDYDALLTHHQTPRSLVDAISGKPLLFPPGSKYLHEEHSAYNLLALVIEKTTGNTFARAMQTLVFGPLHMKRSGVDDDRPLGSYAAAPHDPEGVYGLKPSPGIHWSGKTGNASVFVTAADQCRWMRALFDGDFLKRSSRAAMLDTSERVGFGWFRTAKNPRFGGPLYYMNGHSPGFSSAVLYLPEPRLSVVVLSNIYSSAPTTIGYDVAEMALGKPVGAFHSVASTSNDAALIGTGYRFGPKFYQPNVILRVIAVSGGIGLEWGDKRVSPLIPVANDQFVDRAYWTPVVVKRTPEGKPATLVYDGIEGQLAE